MGSKPNFCYTIHVICSSNLKSDISESLPRNRDINVKYHEISWRTPIKMPENDTVILYLPQDTIHKAVAWFKQNNRLTGAKTALVSRTIRVKTALQLIKTGYSEVFDLDDDHLLISDWIIRDFEQKVNAIRSGQTDNSQRKPKTKIIGKSLKIKTIRKLAQHAAGFSDMTVLVQGETGTGKELVARYIHEHSDRSKEMFIEVNCAAIPETLIESEMLGHEKGAFTDARHMKKGFFEMAHGGTLFLDEIGVMPLRMQNKILKIVEEKRFRRIGGQREIETDVRIIAGTNVDLKSAAQAGRFRPDLYYRLNVFPVLIPPLRDRGNDIQELAEYFLNRINTRYSLKVSGYHPSALLLLNAWQWPGNVRELKHFVERAAVLCEAGRIMPGHLPQELQDSAGDVDLHTVEDKTIDTARDDDHISIRIPSDGMAMDDLERLIVKTVLDRCNGNQSKAARFLKISRTRLIRKMPRKLGNIEDRDQ